MSDLYSLIIIVLFLGVVVGAVLLIRKTSKPFHLSKQQLRDIKKRNKMLSKQEEKEDEGNKY